MMCDWLDRLHADDADGRELLRELLDPDDGFDVMQELIARVAADELEAERIRMALNDAGCKPGEFGSILTTIKRRAAEMRADWRTGNNRPEPSSVVPGRIPAGYLADEQIWKIIKRGDQETMVIACHAACWVSRRMIDADDYSESWELSWVERGEPRTVQCPRSVAQTARGIVALADCGFPVSSDTAGLLVGYLEAYAAYNEIERVTSARHMGWVGDAFVWGERCIGGQIQPVRTDPAGLGRIVASCISRQDDAAAARLHELRIAYPVLMAAYAASLSSVVLQPLRASGFVLSMDGRTSAGKTTALRLAASAWGDPDDTDGLVYSWNETAYFMAQRAANLGHLPLCIDDTRQWKGRPEALSDLVYDITKGRERGRMMSGHTAQEQRFWRLVALSTGEEPLAQSSEAGGLRARVLQVWGSPFGGSQADDVRDCNRATAAHYGVDGPAFVEAIQRYGCERIAQRRDEWLRTHPVSGDVGNRLATHAALVAAVAWTAAEWLRWPMRPQDAAEMVWAVLLPGVQATDADADPADRAWDDIQSWLGAQLASIWHPERGYQASTPPQWVAGATADEWHVYPHTLRRWARESGFRAPAILRAWDERGGRLIRREAGTMTAKVTVGGQRSRVYVLRREG